MYKRQTSPRGAGILPAVPEAAPEIPSSAAGEWPEPDAASSGGTASSDHKRKRRRRKGKGQSAQAHAVTGTTEENPSAEEADEPVTTAPVPVTAPRPAPVAPQHPRQPVSRVKVDPETLTRKAWKIFLAEVSEEGVALIGDQDARELARRCFRLAEIFIEEQSRRVPSA